MARHEESAIVALRELRSIEEQRVLDEERQRAREMEEQRLAREREERRRAREIEERRAREEEAARARSDELRGERDRLALEVARLRGELTAAMDHIAARAEPVEEPAPRRPWGWMAASTVAAAAALGFGVALAARPSPALPPVEPPPRVVMRECPAPPPPVAAPAPEAPARAPAKSPRKRVRGAPPVESPGPLIRPRDCGDDPLCHMDHLGE